MEGIQTTEDAGPNEEPDVASFCQQCRHLAPRISVPVGLINEKLSVVEGSACPLCLFFAAVLHEEYSPSTVSRTTRFNLLDYHGPSTMRWPRNFSFQNCFIQSKDTGVARFMLPASGLQDQGLRLRFRVLPNNSIDYQLLRNWLRYCRSHHGKHCSYQGDTSELWVTGRSALKVIDCTTSKVVTAPKDAAYVALSYVWGKSSALDTAMDTPQLDLKSLPATIQDAMKVTLELGYQYLWCDKYCFDQRTDPHQLQTQLSMMATIYSAAVLTIVAAAGSHSEYGLPGVGARPRLTPPNIRLNGTTWVAVMDDFKAPVRESPWSQRAWTYQEEFYSRVQLIFTEQQVIFECNSRTYFESVAVEDHSKYIRLFGGSSSASLRGVWEHPFHEHILRYTKRNLSHQSDVLNAMRGLFRSLSMKESPWYQYWGIPLTSTVHAEIQSNAKTWDHLWEDGIQIQNLQNQLDAAFCRDLCWIVSPDSSAKHAPRRRENFPSWSWSGWITPVIWADTSPLTWDSILPLEVHAIRTDGTSEPLTEELAISAFEDQGNEALIYTYRLRIHTRVFDLRFIYLEDEGLDPLRIYIRSTGTFKNAVYAARRFSPHSWKSRGEFHYWLLDLTPQVRIDEELHHALCNKVFKGVILCKDYVLVTRMRHGVVERIGLMSTQGVRARGYVSDMRLGDCFPHSERAIVLG